MTIYESALYGLDGQLVKTAKAYPFGPDMGPQDCADRMARAADAGCTYQDGTYLVWEGLADPVPGILSDAPPAEGRRTFG